MKHLLLGLAVIATATSASAADLGFYAGANVGYATTNTNNGIELKDDSNKGFYVGLLCNQWIGIEVGATDLGNFEIKEDPRITTGEVSMDSVHVALALRGDFVFGADAYAKIGVHDTSWDVESDLGKGSDSSTGFTYQAGLYMPVVEHVGVTLNWQYYDALEIGSADMSINTYSLGLEVLF